MCHIKYIDTLMRDLGLKVNRKSNPLAEMFTPYRPVDYRGLIDEYLATRAKNVTDTPRRFRRIPEQSYKFLLTLTNICRRFWTATFFELCSLCFFMLFLYLVTDSLPERSFLSTA